MALKDLTTPTMISVTDDWLGKDRPLLAGVAAAAALLPNLEQARAQLASSHAAGAKPSAEVTQAIQDGLALDAAHDRKARGLDKVLDGLAELTDDESHREALVTARAEVLGPRGVGITGATYTDEATNARLVDERLSPASKKLLKELAIGDRTLGKWVKDWQAVASKLDATAKRKTELEAQAKGPGPADAVRARNLWIRTVNALLGVLELNATPEELAKATVHLDKALAQAARRGSAKGGDATPGAPPPATPPADAPKS